MCLFLGWASPVLAIEVQCGSSGDGDAFGWAVASGGDYDGDGTPDIAVGAPCAAVGALDKVGRVKIFSGATGKLLVALAGTLTGERYGAALQFVPDLNGDGKDEIAIASPAFDAPKPGSGVRSGAGRVEVRSAAQGGTVLWEAMGATAAANFGESIGVLADVNGDGKSDLVVGASGAQVDGNKDGVAYLLSGLDGSVITQNDAILQGESWASLVAPAGDVDGDGFADWVVSSNAASLPEASLSIPSDSKVVTVTTTSTTTTSTTTTTTTLFDRAGLLDIVSGKAPYDVLFQMRGKQVRQRFGRAVAATPDANSDNKSDLWIGSTGLNNGGLQEAGAIDLMSVTGTRIRRVQEHDPQAFASFGTSIVVPGSLDGGPGSDVAAGAPLAQVSNLPEVGRVEAFDGATGTWRWTTNGFLGGEHFGNALAAGIDYNGDTVPDVIVGAPGATPAGRRGAGQAYVLSGSTGKILATFPGRRGRESRFFIAGPDMDRQAVIRGFDPFGHRREANITPFRGKPVTLPSLAILDPPPRSSTPDQVPLRVLAAKTLLVTGTGKGGGPNVAVYRATRRRSLISRLSAGQAGYTGGLNVAGGNFAAKASDEIAVAPADNVTGTSDVVIYQRFSTFPDGRIPSWDKVTEFPVFKPTDVVDTFAVNAVGVNIVAGNVKTVSKPNVDFDEIVASPSAGLPVVRVFSNAGVQIAQWRAYATEGPTVGTNSGVSLAIGDLKGNGGHQIITAPARGQLWIKAWQYDGTPFTMSNAPGAPEVSFFVTQFGPVFEGGLTVTTADVDFDGADEIIVAPGSGIPGQILAFEADGTLVSGWTTFQPYGPLATHGLSLFGMNDFWRP